MTDIIKNPPETASQTIHPVLYAPTVIWGKIKQHGLRIAEKISGKSERGDIQMTGAMAGALTGVLAFLKFTPLAAAGIGQDIFGEGFAGIFSGAIAGGMAAPAAYVAAGAVLCALPSVPGAVFGGIARTYNHYRPSFVPVLKQALSDILSKPSEDTLFARMKEALLADNAMALNRAIRMGAPFDNMIELDGFKGSAAAFCVDRDRMNCLGALIKCGALLDNPVDKTPALTQAILLQRRAAVKLLAHANAEINDRHLELAASQGQADIREALVLAADLRGISKEWSQLELNGCFAAASRKENASEEMTMPSAGKPQAMTSCKI